MYDTITNYNERNHTPLSKAKIREAINKVILEERSEPNNVTVGMFNTMRKKGENVINKVKKLTINDVGNDLIDKGMNMTINNTGNDMIGCVSNLTINNVGYDLNGTNTSNVQFQLAGDPAGKTDQNLLSIRKTKIILEEVPVLDPPMEQSIGSNNQPYFTFSTGVVQYPKALKTPTAEVVVVIKTAYNMGANRNPWKVSSNGTGGSTPVISRTRAVNSGSGTSAVYTSPPPPSGCIWKGIIGNIRKATTPTFKKSSELNATIEIILTNDSIAPSVRSQIIRDELSNISSGDIY